MRIVYVLLSPTFGMHQYTADLANRVPAGLWPVAGRFARDEAILVTTAGYPADRYSPAVRVETSLQTTGTGLAPEGLRIRDIGHLGRHIVSLEPDVVHFTGPHLWNVPLLRYLAGRGIPTVHTLHDLDPHKGRRFKSAIQLWNRLVISSAGYILVHGERYRARLLHHGVASARVACTPLLHLFLSYEQHLALASLDGGDGDGAVTCDPSILFFGRLEAYKGVDVLLTAYAEVLSHAEAAGDGHLPQLVLAGRGDVTAFWAGALPHGVQVRSGLVGDGEALELFRRCSVVVLPYVDATQSALIPAAYFFRKPVIVTRTGVLPEYVVDEETGFVVEPNHPASLGRALTAAMADRERLRRMGEAGRAWYELQRLEEASSLMRLYCRAAGDRRVAATRSLGERVY